jgi:membrane fusion protein, multidrug efflux system
VPLDRVSCAGLLLLAVVSASGCHGAAEPAAESNRPVAVSIAVARVSTLRDVATASGTVAPASTADVTIFSSDLAQIVELPKKEEDTVAVGDVLVRLEIASVAQELAALQLDVMEASNHLDRARSELARQTNFFERGLTSRNDFDASRVALSAAEMSQAQAKARMDAAQASEDRTLVRAKFSGKVMKVWHAVGDAVRAGSDDPILRIIDPTRVQVSLQLPIAQLARVIPGQAATVTAIGGVPEPAIVVGKVGTTDASAPTGEVRLGFTNPATLPLDTPVSAEILFDQRTNTLLVPAAAVTRDDAGYYAMIVGDDLRAHRRDVQLGLTTKEAAQVTNGLAIGDRVITTGLADVTDGSPIVISR